MPTRTRITLTAADFEAAKHTRGPLPEPRLRPINGDRGVAPKAALHPAFLAWQGGTSLGALVGKYDGCASRSATRKILTAAAGGKAQFRALRDQGAGGTAVPFGGKRAAPRTTEQRAVDDAGVKHIHGPIRWQVERLYEPAIVNVEKVGKMAWRKERLVIYTHPKSGNRYVKAKPSEKADLIEDFRGPLMLGVPSGRLKRYDEGKTAKMDRAYAKLVQRGQARYEAKRAAKRAARTARRHK